MIIVCNLPIAYGTAGRPLENLIKTRLIRYFLFINLSFCTLNLFFQNLQLIGTFATCEQFWQIYSHLVRPGDLNSHSDFHMFKKGIKPLWEDEANRYGGKWIVRLRKGLSSRCWENLVMAMLGEQFMVGEEICGAVVSIRYQEDILSVWNRTANDTGVTNRIRDTFRRVLNLPPGTTIEYKAHNDSIK